MTSETVEYLLQVIANLMANQRDMAIKIIAAEHALEKYSPERFEAYRQEIGPATAAINMTPQMLSIENLRKLLNQS